MGLNSRKKHVCDWPDCGRAFNRSDHLQRHVLNHQTGESTCPRCSAHFKRQDLLERHLARHRQKDEEAGGEGLGVVCTRKRLWRDADGNIVSKKPTTVDSRETSQRNEEQSTEDDPRPSPQRHHGTSPLSPPYSDPSAGVPTQHDLTALQSSEQLQDGLDFSIFQEQARDPFDFFTGSEWGDIPADAFSAPTNVEMDDMFNPDTASSFNMPFTTMSNYKWLFDVPKELHPTSDDQSRDTQSGHTSARPGYVETSQDWSAQPLGFGIGTAAPVANMAPSTASSTCPQYEDYSHGHIPAVAPNQQSASRQDQRDGMFLNSPKSVSGSELFHTGSDAQSRDINDYTRSRLLEVVMKASKTTPDGPFVSGDHPLLALPALQDYCDMFFYRFNKCYPLIHAPSFNPCRVEPLLLLAIVLLGATYGSKEAHGLAVCIHDGMRTQIFQHLGFTPTPELWMLQTILLTECFGKSRAGQKQHDMSHLFHGMLINLIRRSDCQTVRTPNFAGGPPDVDSQWRTAMDVEQRKRLALLCFLWDTEHAVLFSQSLCMSAFELRTTMPCDPDLWDAPSALEWSSRARNSGQEPGFLAVLKSYMSPPLVASPPRLNSLSMLLALHGLMSIFWDLKRRDQTSLGAVGPTADWKARMSQVYKSWKQDFDIYCMDMSMKLKDSPALKAEFTRFSTSTFAIFHTAHIVLNVEILDLQIYAGARHIMGRPVSRNDQERSRRTVKQWASETPSSASTAAWHAAQILREGIMTLEDWDVDQRFHYAWCLYLASLVCWAFQNISECDGNLSGNGPHHDERRDSRSPESTMYSLISSMTSAGPEGLTRLAGGLPTTGLLTVMTKHLSNIRWAVVYEGMKVLRSLIPANHGHPYDFMK